ncbi:MAG: hypothetical protein AAF938_23685 [Myxococcota bacterium]
MALALKPFVGLGPIVFGDSEQRVLELLGEPSARFAEGGSRVLSFDALGRHVFLSSETRAVHYFDAFAPSTVSINAIWLVRLADGLSIHALISEHAQGMKQRPYDEGIDLPELGVSLYAPHGSIEALGIFSAPLNEWGRSG